MNLPAMPTTAQSGCKLIRMFRASAQDDDDAPREEAPLPAEAGAHSAHSTFQLFHGWHNRQGVLQK